MNQTEKVFEDLKYETGCFYTNERNKQIIIYLLKKYGINKIIVSPGATNFALVGSMQHDPFFEMFSCVDERAAAYMAIGMSEKIKEPVVLSCTGATASRNYMAALTYAYKQNIPILVITSSLSLASVGHLKPQVTDREHSPVDMIFKSYQFDNIKSSEDEWKTNVKCNEAINQLLFNKKPVHINVCTDYSLNFGVKEIVGVKYIPSYYNNSILPALPKTNICVFIGSHKKFSKEQTIALEKFCKCQNAVVMCDHTSGYTGNYKVNMTLPFSQEYYHSQNQEVGLLIHIGEVSGDYYTFGGLKPKKVWRVNEDGAYSDFFHKLTAVFKMTEADFFNHYYEDADADHSYYYSCLKEKEMLSMRLPDVPFSNIWIAKILHDKLPKGSQLHLGILNSLRSWDFFDLSDGVESKSNVGGFGIDGCISSLIGAASVSPKKKFFGVFGDLAFYYDVNVFLNQQLPKNCRIILINNGGGVEFRNYCHPASIAFEKAVNPFIAATGHFNIHNHSAVAELCRCAGIDYYSTSSKEEFAGIIDVLVSGPTDRAIIVECFTEAEDESDALRRYRQCISSPYLYFKGILRYIKKKIYKN